MDYKSNIYHLINESFKPTESENYSNKDDDLNESGIESQQQFNIQSTSWRGYQNISTLYPISTNKSKETSVAKRQIRKTKKKIDTVEKKEENFQVKKVSEISKTNRKGNYIRKKTLINVDECEIPKVKHLNVEKAKNRIQFQKNHIKTIYSYCHWEPPYNFSEWFNKVTKHQSEMKITKSSNKKSFHFYRDSNNEVQILTFKEKQNLKKIENILKQIDQEKDDNESHTVLGIKQTKNKKYTISPKKRAIAKMKTRKQSKSASLNKSKRKNSSKK